MQRGGLTSGLQTYTTAVSIMVTNNNNNSNNSLRPLYSASPKDETINYH